MPYCNHCGRFIEAGQLCDWCDPQGAHTPPHVLQTPAAETIKNRESAATGGENGENRAPDSAAGAAPYAGDAESEPTEAVGAEPEKTGASFTEEEGGAAENPVSSPAEEAESKTAPEETEAEAAPAGQERECAGKTGCGDCRTDGEGHCAGCGFPRAIYRVLDTPDTTAAFTQRDIREHRAMAVLCYLWVLWLIPFLRARSSRYVRYHLGQGLLLLLMDCLGATFCGIAYLLGGALPVCAPAFAALAEVTFLISFLLKIFGIVCAARGRARELPLFGGYGVVR